jgi:hypothetical protein
MFFLSVLACETILAAGNGCIDLGHGVLASSSFI